MLINHANLSILFQGFKKNFQSGFAGVSPVWSKFATLVPSSTEAEFYAWLEDFPQFREWLGSRRIKDIVAQDYSILNRLWEGTVGVKRTKIEDDVFGTYAPIFSELGASAARHGDELMFDTLIDGDGGGATPGVGYDGVTFFNATHPTKAGAVSNIDTGGGVADWYVFDATRPLKPLIYQQRIAAELEQKVNPATSDDVFNYDRYMYGGRARDAGGYGFWQMAFQSNQTINETNLDAIIAGMMALESDNGKKLGVAPSLLVCGPSNRAAAKALLETMHGTGGATNRSYKAVDLIVTPYLT